MPDYTVPGWPPNGAPLWQTTPVPKGCICPPGSEKTCQRRDCGRKDVPSVSDRSQP